MDSKTLNIGSRNQQFILTRDPSGIPMWATEIDEFWLRMVAGYLYDFFSNNRDKLVTSNLGDRLDFAASVRVSDFKNKIFTGEVERFKDIIFALQSVLSSNMIDSSKMYVSFFSMSGSHYVNAMIDEEAFIAGARLGDMKDNTNGSIIMS